MLSIVSLSLITSFHFLGTFTFETSFIRSFQVLLLLLFYLFHVFLGEVHLQKCLTDLYDMGQNNIKVSEPSVPFFETIISIPGTPNNSMQPVVSI